MGGPGSGNLGGNSSKRRTVEKCAVRFKVGAIAGCGDRATTTLSHSGVTQSVELLAHQMPNGGRRYHFVCPYCGRAVRGLFMPRPGAQIACRHCHKLAYKSAQEAHKMDRILAVLCADICKGYTPKRLDDLFRTIREAKPLAVPVGPPTECGAFTRIGCQCRRKPCAGRLRCSLHGGKSTGPKTADGKARSLAALANRPKTRRVGPPTDEELAKWLERPDAYRTAWRRGTEAWALYVAARSTITFLWGYRNAFRLPERIKMAIETARRKPLVELVKEHSRPDRKPKPIEHL